MFLRCLFIFLFLYFLFVLCVLVHAFIYLLRATLKSPKIQHSCAYQLWTWFGIAFDPSQIRWKNLFSLGFCVSNSTLFNQHKEDLASFWPKWHLSDFLTVPATVLVEMSLIEHSKALLLIYFKLVNRKLALKKKNVHIHFSPPLDAQS